MRIYPDCIVCLLRLALRTARLATEARNVQLDILKDLTSGISELPEDAVPIEVGRRIQDLVSGTTGIADPYKEIKRQCNDLALDLYPRLNKLVRAADDPLPVAIRLAIAGNMIDFAAGSEFDLEKAIEDCLEGDFSVCDYEPFWGKLSAAEVILYLGDNAGEIVLDRLLIEELLRRGKQVTYVVRGGPAINDATLADARYVGLDEMVEVITSGGALPGVMLKYASREFAARFRSADLILSKGQGNFEGLSHEPGPIVFLFKAKCRPVARELGVDQGAMVLRAGRALELEMAG